ncbi:hypothetical protein GWP85_07175 [Acinetobacter beijerinckii]|uniref:hypothetical protein n=1 Tax=Acinetobacter beijerinckii TaxID=262668 RepID=UPI000F6DA570|nr:hypothetical protein [Acinetobacter beijerinckii]AZM39860.1 hypothetical protein EJP75_15835 [Acinetobacter baumannii]MDF2417297.1 hypothetical protein [Acinetobacter beijerinckii]
MGLKVLGLKENDEKKLLDGLNHLRALNDHLSSTYSLRSDLRDLTDNRHTVSTLLQGELNKISAHQQNLIKKTNELSELKLKLDEALLAIEKIQDILVCDENDNSIYSRLLEITEEDNLDILEDKSEKIHTAYSNLFDRNEEDTSKIDQVNYQIGKISREYEKLFDEVNDNEETKIKELERKVNELIEYYDDLFISDNPDIKSKHENINFQLIRVQNFYDKIYGNDEKKIKALNEDLDKRLENLQNVEERAKSVIGLSSEAGLAGGFVIKGKEAKKGQLISIIVFILVVLAIFVFNFYLFDKSDFENMKWDTFIFKLLINAPLIWIATIANINLNRFSKLEQEYSHKEALAKSYERYKTEIQELENLGVTGSEELKLKLLEINLEAFKVNPAESSDKAKPDFSIWDVVKGKTDSKNDE